MKKTRRSERFKTYLRSRTVGEQFACDYIITTTYTHTHTQTHSCIQTCTAVIVSSNIQTNKQTDSHTKNDKCNNNDSYANKYIFPLHQHTRFNTEI